MFIFIAHSDLGFQSPAAVAATGCSSLRAPRKDLGEYT